MLLKFAVKQGGGKVVEFAAFGHQGGGSQPVMVAVNAAILFPVNNVLNKSFQVVTILVDHPQINLAGIGLQGLLASETLRVWMDVVPVKKPHDFQATGPEGFNGVDGAGCAAYVQ